MSRRNKYTYTMSCVLESVHVTCFIYNDIVHVYIKYLCDWLIYCDIGHVYLLVTLWLALSYTCPIFCSYYERICTILKTWKLHVDIYLFYILDLICHCFYPVELLIIVKYLHFTRNVSNYVGNIYIDRKKYLYFEILYSELCIKWTLNKPELLYQSNFK
jgi:hypothetical protein